MFKWGIFQYPCRDAKNKSCSINILILFCAIMGDDYKGEKRRETRWKFVLFVCFFSVLGLAHKWEKPISKVTDVTIVRRQAILGLNTRAYESQNLHGISAQNLCSNARCRTSLKIIFKCVRYKKSSLFCLFSLHYQFSFGHI